MKLYFALLSSLTLSGCIFSNSNDIKHAEKILAQFQCTNIESTQLNHTSITTYHERILYISKQKSQNYIESYKNGDKLFDIPLSEVLTLQYSIYKDACQSLGGLHTIPDS
ncbi:hypothetical protein B9T31_03385 [Acinetobacter sp. ANC 4558]|uniref:hypothetical protein n=1 Tax=Acinetobacter sp. ANC 4558 TaxID=1977876 RepID=UPI000A340FE8|nr:hypothetical protein [Acinetobacter sp. ANC 4558]OTG87557.1 hypothetical protein B9T31_03385 [Acinetobacter sp. ANC 4558]